jgi:hypothetical protein
MAIVELKSIIPATIKIDVALVGIERLLNDLFASFLFYFSIAESKRPEIPINRYRSLFSIWPNPICKTIDNKLNNNKFYFYYLIPKKTYIKSTIIYQS